MATELQVISDLHDLTLYLVGRIAKFPRLHRYSLGNSMEKRLQGILALLIQAKYCGVAQEKCGLLSQVNVELEVLRFQLRLAKDLQALALNSHGHTIQLLERVGSQVGGWVKAARLSAKMNP